MPTRRALGACVLVVPEPSLWAGLADRGVLRLCLKAAKAIVAFRLALVGLVGIDKATFTADCAVLVAKLACLA